MNAEKVEGFPHVPGRGGHRLKYPFKQIAEDGGVWRLDPRDYDAKGPGTVGNAAAAWARRNGYHCSTQTHEDCLYVQFTTLNGKPS